MFHKVNFRIHDLEDWYIFDSMHGCSWISRFDLVFLTFHLLFHRFLNSFILCSLILFRCEITKLPPIISMYICIFVFYLLIILVTFFVRYTLDLRCERSLLTIYYDAFRVLNWCMLLAYQFLAPSTGIEKNIYLCLTFSLYILVIFL